MPLSGHTQLDSKMQENPEDALVKVNLQNTVQVEKNRQWSEVGVGQMETNQHRRVEETKGKMDLGKYIR